MSHDEKVSSTPVPLYESQLRSPEFQQPTPIHPPTAHMALLCSPQSGSPACRTRVVTTHHRHFTPSNGDQPRLIVRSAAIGK
ncbi:hypothetical protein N8T08_008362 [Aspergillus melleus]|uniref:Uncharacterized protein n=1 Tax=Aspergillus melleus TaxID=138277 RepID=A0ACC3AVG4_9EURO|nr:hypothetical protein N8T08_008362 [Aspergillus melleus]